MLIEELGIKKKSWTNTYVKYIINYLIQAITVIVVAVPEGLPLAVTLALAFAVKVLKFIHWGALVFIFIASILKGFQGIFWKLLFSF